MLCNQRPSFFIVYTCLNKIQVSFLLVCNLRVVDPCVCSHAPSAVRLLYDKGHEFIKQEDINALVFICLKPKVFVFVKFAIKPDFKRFAAVCILI